MHLKKTLKPYTHLGFLKFNEFTQNLYKYIEARFELAKIETEDRISKIMALVVQLAFLGIMLGSMFLFLTIALALYINTLPFCKGAPYMGFLLVASSHFLLVILLFMLRGSLLIRTKNWLQSALQQFVKYVVKD